MECEHCKSTFKNQYTLKSHIFGNKKCLKLRGMKLESSISCSGCNLQSTNRHNLRVHQKSCKEFIILSIKNENDKVVSDLKEQIEELKIYYNRKNEELKTDYNKNIEIHNRKNEELKNQYKDQIDNLQDIIKILAKEAISRPTTTNNTVNNIRTNLSSIYTLDQIKPDDLIDLFHETLTEKVFMSGQKGLAKLCTEKIINTKDSKKLICCTDISRKKFRYMDKKGNMMEDVEARDFVDKVTKPIKEAGKKVYDTLISNINDERDHVREDEYGKKDRLVNQSFQVMNRYQDIINIDDPKYNTEFTSELAILNK